MNPQVKHPHLFIDDGNIVIFAPSSNVNKYISSNEGGGSGESNGDVGMQGVETQASQGTVLFCVHKSLLARHSQAFGSMFNLAVGELGDALEGRPTVTLPDPAEDVEALLNVIYNPSALPFRYHDPYTTVRVHRALHMATKYTCEDIRKRIIEHVKQDWPKNLDDFEYEERQVGELMHKTSRNLDLLLPEPASSYRLGKLFDIPEILPASFYILTTLKTHQDFDIHRSAAYKNHNPPIVDATHLINVSDRTARFNLLDVQDFRALYQWREYINDFKLERQYEELDTCLVSCEEETEKFWESFKKKFREIGDVLWTLQNTTAVTKLAADEFICVGCANNFYNDLHAMKLQLWEEITRLAKSS